MRNLILFLTLITWTINVEATTFTYDIQKAGYGFDQYDLKGKASYSIFIDAFKSYPWKAQVGNSNGGSEATISVRNKSINTDLFVSVVGDANEFSYLIGIVEPKKLKSFFGLGKEKEVRWVSIYLSEQSDDVDVSVILNV